MGKRNRNHWFRSVLFLQGLMLAVSSGTICAYAEGEVPSFQEYEVEAEDGIITLSDRQYYHVTEFHAGQDYLIVVNGHALGTVNSAFFHTSARMGGDQNSVSLSTGAYSLTASDQGLQLSESRRPKEGSPTGDSDVPEENRPAPPPRGGGWKYENEHLVYISNETTYYLSYTEPVLFSGKGLTAASVPEEKTSDESSESLNKTAGEIFESAEAGLDEESVIASEHVDETKRDDIEQSDPSYTLSDMEEETVLSPSEETAKEEGGQKELQMDPEGETLDSDSSTEQREPDDPEREALALQESFLSAPFGFGCTTDINEAAVTAIYTDGEYLNSCITSFAEPFDYYLIGTEHSVRKPSITCKEGLESLEIQWHISDDAEAYSAEAAQEKLQAIETPGVYPLTCTVSGKIQDVYYREVSSAVNYIVTKGVLENSILTFSDVHMEFEGIGKAIDEIMEKTDGRIPSLVVCTGDWANGHGITYEYTKDTILSMIRGQLCGLDTVYVAGNHEVGAAASEATIESDLGADETFMKGYGMIFDSESAGVESHGKNSRYAEKVAVYGINYDAMAHQGEYSYAHIVEDVKAFLENTAKRDSKTLAVISTHAGIHVVNDGERDWTGGAAYNITDSYLLTEAINEAAKKYNLDVLFLFGHDHSHGEAEFIQQRDEIIRSPISYREQQYKEETLCFTYGHAGYMTSSIGVGRQHYSLITWDENTLTRNLKQIRHSEEAVTVIERLSKEPQYSAVSGDGSVYKKGSGKNLSFEVKRNGYDLSYDLFSKAEVDGKQLAETDYQIKEGGLILDLGPAFLETLSAGKHTTTLFFDDNGSISLTFTVRPKTPVPTPYGPSEESSSSALVVPVSNPSVLCSVSPDTSDSFRLMHWMRLEVIGILGALASIWFLRKS